MEEKEPVTDAFSKNDEGEYSEDTRDKIQQVMETWFNAFAASPSFTALPANQQKEAAFVVRTFSEYMYSYGGETPPRWSLSGLHETCLHTLQRKVSAEDDYYQAIAPVLAEFFLFAHGRGWLRNGEALAHEVASLREDIVCNSRDPANWGMGKSMMMAGKKAGFDMSTKKGIDAYVNAHNAGVLINPRYRSGGSKTLASRQPATLEGLAKPLDCQELIDELRGYDDYFPEEAVSQALLRQREITPFLLEALAEIRENVISLGLDEAEEEGASSLLAHATFLLAYFHESRACDPLCDILELPKEMAEALISGDVEIDLCRLLAAVCGGDTSRIDKMAINPNVCDVARQGAIGAWLVLFIAGKKSREDMVAYFRSLYEGGLERVPSTVWSELAKCCSYIQAAELRPAIKEAFAEGLAEVGYFDEYDMEDIFALTPDEALEEAATGEYDPIIATPAEELDWQEDDEGYYGDDEYADDQAEIDIDMPRQPDFAPPDTIRNDTPKIRPNDPCPCGSGKKHKKCCGRN